MAQDSLPPPPTTDRPERPPRPGRIAIAGVFGACFLGGGLGLWARPAPETPVVVAQAEPLRPALQVVVDDTPAPVGALLEVLPADLAAPSRPSALPRLIPVEPLAPRRTAGLVKVDAVVAPTQAPAPVPMPAPVPVLRIEKAVEPVAPPKALKVQVASPGPAKPVRAAKPVAKVEKAVEKPRPKKAEPTRVAKVEKAKPSKPVLAKAAPAKARADKQLAKAARKSKPAVARDEAKPKRLAVLAKSTKAAPQKVAAKAKIAAKPKSAVAKKPKTVQFVAVKPKVQKAKVVQAKAAKPAPVRKPKVEHARVERKAAPPPRRIVPRGEGPMRVARADACASHDPGEAMVCADRRLAARDRQLQQAYRNAEAAGVPASALRRQQDRWVQARAAAAREAPWAVEDVYVARISELHDLSRDANEN
jgi:hypothetical protein